MRILPLGHSLSCLALCAATGCATYQPAPLDLPAQETHWRDLEPAKGLSFTLAQAEAFALCSNPHLRTLRAEAGIAQVAGGLAGLWDDPNFSLGLSRRTAGGASPWLVEGGIGFSIPLSGRLEVQRKLARNDIDAAQAGILVAEADLLRELRLAVTADQNARRKFTVLSAHAERLAALAERAAKIAAVGEASRLEAGALAISAMEAAGEAAKAEAEIPVVQLRVLELMGLRPEASLVLQEDKAPWGLPADKKERLAQHPRLLFIKAQYAAAESAYELEVRRQYPDLDIGPTAKWEDGQTNLGLGLGLPIPAWNRNRLAIARAQAKRESLKVQAEEIQQSLRHSLAQAELRTASASALAAQLRRRLSPMLAAQDQQVQALLESGELDPLRLGDVLNRRRDSSLSLLEADRAAAEAQIEIRSLVDALPASVPAQPTDPIKP